MQNELFMRDTDKIEEAAKQNVFRIEDATEADAGRLLEIYAPYVTDTAISFEYTVPSVSEFRERIRSIRIRYPYIKAVRRDGTIAGYAYASAFKGRAAYDYSVETTIYLEKNSKRMGIGRSLYAELERRLREEGILNMNACIAYPESEDPYVGMDSVFFHERMGFSKVGIFHDSGYKFGRWYHMIWMEKMIGEHGTHPPKLPWKRDVQSGGIGV